MIKRRDFLGGLGSLVFLFGGFGWREEEVSLVERFRRGMAQVTEQPNSKLAPMTATEVQARYNALLEDRSAWEAQWNAIKDGVLYGTGAVRVDKSGVHHVPLREISPDDIVFTRFAEMGDSGLVPLDDFTHLPMVEG